jgi:hypothetical protein
MNQLQPKIGVRDLKIYFADFRGSLFDKTTLNDMAIKTTFQNSIGLKIK